MYPFLKLTKWEKVLKNRYKIFIVLQKTVRRRDNFSASYSFHPAQNGKIFQHRLIYFIHTNAMAHFQS